MSKLVKLNALWVKLNKLLSYVEYTETVLSDNSNLEAFRFAWNRLIDYASDLLEHMERGAIISTTTSEDLKIETELIGIIDLYVELTNLLVNITLCLDYNIISDCEEFVSSIQRMLINAKETTSPVIIS